MSMLQLYWFYIEIIGEITAHTIGEFVSKYKHFNAGIDCADTSR